MSLPTTLPDDFLAILQQPNPLPPTSNGHAGTPAIDPLLQTAGSANPGQAEAGTSLGRHARDDDDSDIDVVDQHRIKQHASNMLMFVRKTLREPGYKVKSGYQREIENFALSEHPEQLVKLFIRVTQVLQGIEAIATDSSSGNLVITSSAGTNIKEFSGAIVLSPVLTKYRGVGPVNAVMAALRAHTSDVPASVDTNPAHYNDFTNAISKELTQRRSDLKKAIIASVEGAPEQHLNILALAKSLASKAKVTVTIQMCGRLAVVRNVHTNNPNAGLDFWKFVDNELELFRESSSSPAALVGLYRHLLENDIATHGSLLLDDLIAVVPEGGLNEAVDERQQQANQAIADVQGTPAPAATATSPA